ncbi:hypothetical protein IT414_00840 [bacterium]|nr:hypothetical protein [bacterium]
MLTQKRRKGRGWFWRYSNTLLLAGSLVLLGVLAQTPALDQFVQTVGSLGYVGAFIAGIFFVSTFTVAPAALVLIHFAQSLDPVEVALLGGAGAVVGDLIVFSLLRDHVFDELKPLFRRHRPKRLLGLMRSPYFAWILPIIGAAIVASPLPDEAGVGLLGASKMRRWHFVALTFLLNSIGIYIIATSVRLN